MRVISLVVLWGVAGAAWAGDAPASEPEDGCGPDRVLRTLADGMELCVSTRTSVAAVAPSGPTLSTTVVGPAIAWRDASATVHGSGRPVADVHTALPYGHTVGGFVALAPGLDQAGRYDGQALSVWLDGVPLMSPQPVALPDLAGTRLR